MMSEIQALHWDRYIHLAGLNLLMGSQPSSLAIWISNYNAYKTYALLILVELMTINV
jgi:hypothetical protein